ncbi:MAG: hypothetical protein M5U32_09490 [Myxococcota bacterium]|nr:hypothetical protein [Myxococcota bacterium]
MLSGYRGFLRELARTGSWRAFAFQARTGAGHVARRVLRLGEHDPIARFYDNYGADGFRLPDPERSRLQLAAEACLACGLCTIECARIDGTPAIEPRDAVLSAARLEIDWIRLGIVPVGADRGPSASAPAAAGRTPAAATCGGCRACERVCPVAIRIAGIQDLLVAPGRSPSPAAAGRDADADSLDRRHHAEPLEADRAR